MAPILRTRLDVNGSCAHACQEKESWWGSEDMWDRLRRVYEMTHDMDEPFAHEEWIRWCKLFEKEHMHDPILPCDTAG